MSFREVFLTLFKKNNLGGNKVYLITVLFYNLLDEIVISVVLAINKNLIRIQVLFILLYNSTS